MFLFLVNTHVISSKRYVFNSKLFMYFFRLRKYNYFAL
jgi:hypothetical protein